jgi:hypothetical protein
MAKASLLVQSWHNITDFLPKNVANVKEYGLEHFLTTTS